MESRLGNCQRFGQSLATELDKPSSIITTVSQHDLGIFCSFSDNYFYKFNSNNDLDSAVTKRTTASIESMDSSKDRQELDRLLIKMVRVYLDFSATIDKSFLITRDIGTGIDGPAIREDLFGLYKSLQRGTRETGTGLCLADPSGPVAGAVECRDQAGAAGMEHRTGAQV
jgi:hypothetical protein